MEKEKTKNELFRLRTIRDEIMGSKREDIRKEMEKESIII